MNKDIKEKLLEQFNFILDKCPIDPETFIVMFSNGFDYGGGAYNEKFISKDMAVDFIVYLMEKLEVSREDFIHCKKLTDEIKEMMEIADKINEVKK